MQIFIQMANQEYRFNGKVLDLPLLQGGGFHNFMHTLALGWHKHANAVEITYVMQGDTCWLLRGGTELFHPGGTMAIVQPGVEHCGQGNVIQPCWLFWFQLDFSNPDAARNTVFTAEELRILAESFKNSGNRVCPAPAGFKFYAEKMFKALFSSTDGVELHKSTLRSLFCQMVLEFAQVFSRNIQQQNTGDVLVEQAEKIMRANLHKPIDILSTATKLGLSQTGFSKQFKQKTGMTPADYCRRIKIMEARQRLKKNISITAIAYELGFSSSQHFAAVFKNYTGATPKDFRSRQRREQ